MGSPPQRTATAGGDTSLAGSADDLHFKPDAKQAKRSYKEGLDAEQKQDWQAAYEAYSRAVEWEPNNRQYIFRRELVKGRLIQAKVDQGEKDAVSGELANARKALVEAYQLDPTDRTIRERVAELAALEPNRDKETHPGIQLVSEVPLHYAEGVRSFDYRGDTQGLYQQIGQKFGVDAAFDAELHARQVHLQVKDVDFLTAMELAGAATQTFWHALTGKLFFVADDTVQKRREYEPLLVRTIRLPASESPEQVTELARLLRDITGILRVQEDPAGRTITLRADARAMSVAANLIANLETPPGELVLDMEILEVDRAFAQQIGITPPQSAQVYSVASGLLGSGNSAEQIIATLEQLFGTPSALSGLTPTQIATELASGQLNVNSLLPPLIAFGGGTSTFFATLPGAAANLSRTLTLVRAGRRVILRAQDGQPATFFVGEKYPVSLAQYSSSLTTSASTAGITSDNFPISTLSTGVAPAFVTAASLRNNSIQDLIVANYSDNTISVFLGNGDGTFASPVTYPTGIGPVWIATGDFNNDGDIDLAVADKSANTVSILLGNGDGTFKPKVDYPTGAVPVSVVAGDLNGDGNADLAIANQSDNTVSLLFGNGTGTFAPSGAFPSLLATGHAPTALALADFNGATYSNGNSILDLVVANQNDNTVSMFIGNGNGTFQARTDYATGASPVYVATGDFNGDGILDVATANHADNTVSILLGQANASGTASGTLAPQTAYEAGAGPTSIAVADYNRDGVPDLAITDSSANAIGILFGGVGGVFNIPFQIDVGTNPVSIVSADFNGDGIPDGAIANNGSNTVSVILNETSSSTTPGVAAPGTQFPYSEYVDIGLKIKATPRIHTNHEVTLQLHFELSSLAGQSFNSIPVLANDSLDQTVRLKEDQTTLLAGILQPSVSNTLNGIPGLGQVPVLGNILTGNTNVQQGDSQLLILITPHIVRLANRKGVTIYAGRGTGEGGVGYGSPYEGRFRFPQNLSTPPPPDQPDQQPPDQPQQ
ncbi:MAG TPA: FG-GAP-like repeat-containing protein [Candidatus Acidoferrum sp.]|nr:FG-GAP-like repeat-containing protein [Candidatus Acidoferrum sp.]